MSENNTEKVTQNDPKSGTVKKAFNKKLLWLLTIPVAAAGIYGGVTYKQKADWYAEHFYPGTTVGTVDIGEMTVEEAKTAVVQSIPNYSLKVVQRDVEETITSEEIKRHYVTEDDNGADLISGYLAAQNAGKWYSEMKQEHAYDEFEVVYDEKAVGERVKKLTCVSPEEVVQAEDAYINYDEETYTYAIVPEHSGNRVSRKKVNADVLECIESGATELTIPEEYYPQPEIYSDDEEMNAFVDQVEKYLSAEITLKDSYTEVVIDRDEIIEFLDINMEERTVELVQRRVQTYINTALDSAFDTLGKERTITTDLSGTFTVGGGNYGKVVYTLEELPQLMEEITNGETVTREPHWRQNERSDENDGIGYTYVDVNLSKQKLSYIKDGKEVLRSDFVSGMMSEGRQTPTGVYYVALKATEYTMKKYNAFVHYWMNFYPAVGVGFHDATWRGSFGGTIYKNNGSHGCINMPYDNAKILYNNISIGTPVLVHW